MKPAERPSGAPPDAGQCRSLFVVIATYNERENIGALIEKILALEPPFHVLVVDDNSPDGTGQVVQQLAARDSRVHLLSRPAKQGYGSACAAGMNEALRLGARAVFTMDADHSHDPLDLPRLAKELEHSDVVIGSRYVGGVRVINWSLARVFLSCFANRYVRTILGLPYTDCTSGFRGYRREVLEKIPWDCVLSTGYAFLVELLYAAVRTGHSACEVPIVYTERRAGQSKMSRRVIWEAVLRPWVLRFRPWKAKKASQPATAEPSPAIPRWIVWAVLALILTLATFLRFHVLTQDPFWMDEIITARTTQRSTWKEVFASIRNEYAAETPAQIVIATVLYRLFGRSVWLYRSTSALLGVLGVLGVFLLGKRLRNARLGLLAAFLLAIMPYNIRYSQEFRGYAAMACFSAFAAWAFVRAVQEARLRAWVLFGFVGGLSLLFHYFVGLVLLAAGGYCLVASLFGLYDPGKKRWLLLLKCSLSGAIAAAMLAPWLVFVFGKKMAYPYKPTFEWNYVWSTLSQLASTNIQDGIATGPTFVVFYAMAAIGLLAAFALVGRISAFLLFWIATAPLVFWFIAMTSYFFSPRQFLYLQPLLCVLVAMPVEWICTIADRRSARPGRWAVQAAAILGFALLFAVPYQAQIARYYVQGSVNKFFPVDDIGQFLANNARRNDVILYDSEPYIIEYHCGRTDVGRLSQLEQAMGQGRAIWVVHSSATGMSHPMVAAHPPSAQIKCGDSAISYYSTATSFSLPAFLTGLALSKRGAEAAGVGILWSQVSAKASLIFFQSVNTSTMNRRTRADFFCYYGNFFRGSYFLTGNKAALHKAVEYLRESVRANPYNPHLYTFYGDALLYAGELEESCRMAWRGVRRATGDDVCSPAAVGFRSAQNLSDSRQVFEFGALLLKHQKDPKTRQMQLLQCREYLQKHAKDRDLCREIFQRRGVDPNEIIELRVGPGAR